MKKILTGMLWIAAMIVLLPIAMVVALVWYVFIWPIDILRYRKTSYYKATG